jgi:nicotinate-nucleotide--dimethylbenzimidazole phosphoribosyltransferase
VGVDYDFADVEAKLTVPLIKRKVMKGTRNMRKGPAMSREEAEKCINIGIELATEYAKKGYGLFGTGDMGIANTTPSAAIASVLTNKTVSEVTGKGTGIGDQALKNKIMVIGDAIALISLILMIRSMLQRRRTEIGGIAGLIMEQRHTGLVMTDLYHSRRINSLLP